MGWDAIGNKAAKGNLASSSIPPPSVVVRMLVLTGSGELSPLLAENREEEQLPARLFSWAGNTLPSKMHILQLLNS